MKMSMIKLDIDAEYKKNKSLREDVQKLEEWLSKQPHLPNITEQQLITFLNSCYYSQEATKTCIDNYFTMRTHCPEFFKNIDPTTAYIKNQLNMGISAPLPGLSEDGYSILYVKLIIPDPDKFIMNDHVKTFNMVVDLWTVETGTTKGHIILLDMDGTRLAHLARISLPFLKKFLMYFQEALPVRLKAIHHINVVPFIDKFLTVFRPFLKKELMDLLIYHTKNEDVFKYIPQKCLPNEYGGEAGTIPELHSTMLKKLEAHADFYADLEKQTVDENRRPGKAKNAGELYGMEGSFKKLDID